MLTDLVPHKEIQSLLLDAGLNENEARIYTTLLFLSVAPAGTIAKHSGIKRSHTYLLLSSLQERGLVTETNKRGRKHFMAENPQKLVALLQEQERNLVHVRQRAEHIMPLLMALQHTGTRRPIVTVYEGLERMSTMYREMFANEFIALFNPKGMYELFGKSSMRVLGYDRLELRGRELIVPGPAAERFMKATEQTQDYSYRLFKPDIQFDGDIIVFNDTVMVFCYDDNLTVIRLDSHAFAQALRGMFELCWMTSKPLK
jgi:predicted DNA-binding transcriptional regulator